MVSDLTHLENEIDALSQEIQKKPGGNTKTPGANMQYYVYILTIPKGECTASQLSQVLRGLCKKFIFQGERGEKTGYEHWQVALSLKTKEYPKVLKNFFPHSTHIEVAKDGFKVFNYCGKEDSRIEGPYTQDSIFIRTPCDNGLNKFQQEVIDDEIFDDDRKIWCYVDYKGGLGKSALCKYLAVNGNAIVFTNAKTADIAYAMPIEPKVVIFDLPRSSDGHTNWSVIEKTKDGMLFSSKYESCTKVFNSPRVIIFTNVMPDTSKMSLDRWIIKEYNKPVNIWNQELDL